MDTAVVTGAGRGIGREIARGPMAFDVRDPDGHREAAAAAAGRGRLQVWVRKAGEKKRAAA